ncbi:hypothetical protein, partial [Aequorivita sinensis]|uniref:hypothetical protein n=1 Tax=Aequorivita sinensis TaxID=1382458 RepID=UPI002300416F
VLHHLKKIVVIALNILILIGCHSKSKRELIIDKKPIVKEYRTETKFFGDSLKVISEYRGDTIIQERIDLKTSDNNFDSSYTTISVWSTRATSRLDCSDKITLTIDGIDFKFCYEDIFQKIDNTIKKAKEEDEPQKVDRLIETKNKFLNYKRNDQEDLSRIKEFFLFELLREIDFSAYDNQTKATVQKVRIVKYDTNFAGGRTYYLITKTNDTIARFDRTEYIR